MSPQQTRSVLQTELGGVPIEEIFEWIDLEQPLGSASIAQVHTFFIYQAAVHVAPSFVLKVFQCAGISVHNLGFVQMQMRSAADVACRHVGGTGAQSKVERSAGLRQETPPATVVGPWHWSPVTEQLWMGFSRYLRRCTFQAA